MIKLTQPYIPKEAIDKVIMVLQGGNLVQGEYVKKFENDICSYLNVKHAVAVSSGTAALHLSLLALNIKPGDEVILPAFTYPATANVVEIVGAKSVLVDIRLDDFCINAASIENAISHKTKAIIPVHEFGQSAKINEIVSIANKHNIFIIEDAACALGTEFKEQKAGTFGSLGCFSLHPRKAITTGEGGLIVTNDDLLAEKLRSLRNHGIKVNENGKYDFVYAGFNYRMTDFQAALGIEQLKIIEKIISKRIELANYYDEYLEEINWIKTPQKFNDRRMVYQTYHALIDESFDRDELIFHLRKNNIETNIGAYSLASLSYFKEKYGFTDSLFPNAYYAYRKGIALPMGNHCDNETISCIINAIKKFTQ